MITDTALEYTRRMDRYMSNEFGDRYTLKTTYWNDGDFRIIGYYVITTDPDYLPGDARKCFDEVWYQHSKVPDGHAIRVRTAQDTDDSREQTEQYDVLEPRRIELPPDPEIDPDPEDETSI